MKIFIVIAAYNEEKSIKKVLSNFKKLKKYIIKDKNNNIINTEYNIVIVDDGSRDKTYESAKNFSKELNLTVLKHIINRGQGAALKTGIDYALNKNADIIITFDADGQHRIEDIPQMIKPIINRECEVTLGSRFLKKTNMPLFRKITLKTAILVMWIFYGVKMTDAHNGFRAFSREAAKKINITSDRMEHASEIIEEIKRKKIEYKEIPVTILYTDYSLKKGHGGLRQALKVLFRMLFRKMIN
ncbi:MAG: glycosyltransferase family 2 protein [Candidatus Woesearchaeota archaeon]